MLNVATDCATLSSIRHVSGEMGKWRNPATDLMPAMVTPASKAEGRPGIS